MRKPRQFWRFADGLDAAHQDREVTHPTHWPAAEHRGFSRVRSGCACVARSVPRLIPGLAENARRMRGEDGP